VRRLDAALAAAGMSGRGAASAAGLSHSTVQRVLRGEVLPDLGTIARLEVALGVDLYPVGLRARFTSVRQPELP
jgi:transcriptional regulator with XRE-family HTH domain